MGIGWTDGQIWSELRRFTLRHLRDFGLGKVKSDWIIQDEATQLVNEFLKESLVSDIKHNVTVKGQINIPVVNVLWQIVASKRFNSNDKNDQHFVDSVTKIFTTDPHFLQFIPYVGFARPYMENEKAMLDVKEMLRDQIMIRKSQYNPSDEPNDFYDAFLREVAKEEERLGVDYGIETTNFHPEQLIGCCLDLFIAGAETTSSTLKWTMLYLSLYPEVQRKCQQEIDEKIGGNPFLIICIYQRCNFKKSERGTFNNSLRLMLYHREIARKK